MRCEAPTTAMLAGFIRGVRSMDCTAARISLSVLLVSNALGGAAGEGRSACGEGRGEGGGAGGGARGLRGGRRLGGRAAGPGVGVRRPPPVPRAPAPPGPAGG